MKIKKIFTNFRLSPQRLNFQEEYLEIIWINDEIVFSRKENKVTENFQIKFSDFSEFNYVNLKKYSEIMQEYFLSKSSLKIREIKILEDFQVQEI